MTSVSSSYQRWFFCHFRLAKAQAAAAQAPLSHKRTEFNFMQHTSSTRCSGSEMQDWAKHWPNCTFSCMKRIELVCSPLPSVLQNISSGMEGHDTNQNLSMWGSQVQRNQAPSWKHRPHWKGWNEGWFTAGFTSYISWEHKSQEHLLCTESKCRYPQNSSAITMRH